MAKRIKKETIELTTEQLEERYLKNPPAFKHAKPESKEDTINDQPEMVNHPNHYNAGKYECIDVMVDIYGLEAVKQWCIMNAFKYLYRFKNKNGLEDIRKAHWYLTWFIDHEK